MDIYHIGIHWPGFASDLPNEICGSPIWIEAGDVLGFFGIPRQGWLKDWCASVATDELIDRGYTLVDTTGLEVPGITRGLQEGL